MKCSIHKTTPNIGVSSCLLGNMVRYDGKHKLHQKIATELGQFFKLIPFCPEVDSGMGVPRSPIQLVYVNNSIHALDKKYSSPDYTQQLQLQANNYLKKNPNIRGLILQERSPSCGYLSVKTHSISSRLIDTHGTGIFTATILKNIPEVPIIESSSLDDQQAIHNFIQQVNDYQPTKKR